MWSHVSYIGILVTLLVRNPIIQKLRNLPPNWKRSEYLAIVEALADLSYEVKLRAKRAKVIWTEVTGPVSVEDLELSRELREAKRDADAAGFDMDIDHPYEDAEV